MNEFFQQLTERWNAAVNSVATFYRSNRMLVLSGFTILSILLIVWARFGFTVEIGRFFAATYCESQAGGTCRTSCQAGESSGGQQDCGSGAVCCIPVGTVTPTPSGTTTTEPIIQPAPGATIFPSAFSPDGVLTCIGPNLVPPSKTTYQVGEPVVFRSQLTCESLNADARCDQIEATWTLSFGPNQVESCGPTAGGCSKDITHTYTEPGTYHATLRCTAHDKLGRFNNWFFPRDSVAITVVATTEPEPEPPAGPTCGSLGGNLCCKENSICSGSVGSFTCPSGYSSLGESSDCEVCCVTAPVQEEPPAQPPSQPKPSSPPPTVSESIAPTASESPTESPTESPAESATPTESPTASPTATVTVTPTGFGIVVTGRNATTSSAEASTVQVTGGQQVEVIVRVHNAQDTALNNVVVKAVLPTGLTYVNGSTSVGGIPTSVDAITTGGLSLGAVGAGQDLAIVFRASIVSSQFPVGTTQTQVNANITADNAPQNSGALAVIVTRATAGQPGSVQTGPGDAVFAALLISAIVTLLYVSYTHTAAFKRREVETITKGHDSMDFRS